ncbi:MAG TPA: Stp1/IreP family PP2C-type Ser/Thr phosphatase [Blastocatellia bacterium]|nr:Stp1/IreP family PP2C-type Ser/Thr phosphatase [Blastocatellia bacterium]
MFKDRNKTNDQIVRPTSYLGQQSESEQFEVVAGFKSDVGCVRESNEDSGRFTLPDDPAVLAEKGRLFVVADGMGGHSGGEIASRLAAEVITRTYYEDDDDSQTALKNAFREANRQIYEVALKDDSLKGMGTTCTALVLRDGSAISAHVGDSRLYLVRNGHIYLMTEDHSAVMEMVKRGWISLSDARHHPDKNVILRAMGSHPEVEVSTWQEPFPLKAGDRFLLCSDGLYDLVEDEEIKQIVLAVDPQNACEKLIEIAKERGGHDNITVAIASLKRPGDDSKRPVPVTRVVEVVE